MIHPHTGRLGITPTHARPLDEMGTRSLEWNDCALVLGASGIYCSNMSSSRTDASLPEVPNVMTQYQDGVVTISTEGSGRLQVNLNGRILYDDSVSEG